MGACPQKILRLYILGASEAVLFMHTVPSSFSGKSTTYGALASSGLHSTRKRKCALKFTSEQLT